MYYEVFFCIQPMIEIRHTCGFCDLKVLEFLVSWDFVTAITDIV